MNYPQFWFVAKSSSVLGGADDPSGPFASLATTEEEDNDVSPPNYPLNNPMISGFMAPEDDSEEDDLGLAEPNAWGPGADGAESPMYAPVQRSASLGWPPQRAPRGVESGEVGEWQTNDPQGNPDTGGESPVGRPDYMGPAYEDTPKQEGPVFSPSQPPSMASPTAPGPTTPGPVLHHFEQCPQCGVGVVPQDANCPNPWCGHDLANDPNASYDAWATENNLSFSPRV